MTKMKFKIDSAAHEFQDLVKKRMKELEDAREKLWLETSIKAKRLQAWYIVAELLLTLTGYLIIGFMVSWWLVLGLYVLNISRNLSRKREIRQDKKDFWSEIWKF